MFIFGREVGLAVTVGASIKLARLCPDNDLTKIDSLLKGGLTDTLENVMKMAVIMSEAYELKQAHILPDYEPNPLTEEELEALDMSELGELMAEVRSAMARDGAQQINTKPAKGSKKNSAK